MYDSIPKAYLIAKPVPMDAVIILIAAVLVLIGLIVLIASYRSKLIKSEKKFDEKYEKKAEAMRHGLAERLRNIGTGKKNDIPLE